MNETEILRAEDIPLFIYREARTIDSLASRPMQSWTWRLACAESFTEEEQIAIHIRRAGRTVALAVLTIADGQQKLRGLGHELFEPEGFSYADSASCAALAEGLVRLGQPMFFRDVDPDTMLVDTLRRACHGKQICIVRPMAAHPWLPLNQSWQQPEKHLNAGRRSDLRRARRAAESRGAVRFTCEVPEPGSLAPLLTRVFQVEANNWKGRASSAIVRTPKIEEFYRRYAAYTCQQRTLRVLTLSVGDTLAAMQLGVIFNNRFWLLKMGYDESYARCSPGLLLMVESLRWAAEAGLEAFEMMGQEEPWTRLWTDRSHRYVSVRIYAPGVRGLMSFAAEASVAAQRKAVTWIEARKRAA
jgi:CelD/BcsL family acetyltransferase involved in cellulose biosynthesis